MIICGLLIWAYAVLMLVVGRDVQMRSVAGVLLSLLWGMLFLVGYDLIKAGFRLWLARRRDDVSR